MNRKEPEPTDDTTLIANDLRRVAQVLREASRSAEQRVGLSGAQLLVLRVLSDQSVLSLNQLAERTLTHQSTVSVVVRRLVDGGLVRRTPSSDDARRLDLALTPEGRAVLRRAPGAGQERLLRGIERLSEPDRRRLGVLLHRLVEEMDVEDGEPVMFFEEPAAAAARRPRRARE